MKPEEPGKASDQQIYLYFLEVFNFQAIRSEIGVERIQPQKNCQFRNQVRFENCINQMQKFI